MSNFWVQTMSGRKVDLDNLKPDDIDKMDMAHSLSMQVRFNGHCLQFYSVAQHSVLVYDLVKDVLGHPGKLPDYTKPDILAHLRELQIMMAALLHDSPEYLIGDVVNPVKRYIKDKTLVLRELEDKILAIILQKYDAVVPSDIPGVLHPLIKGADRKALAIEKKYIMIPTADSWGKLPDVAEYPPIECLEPTKAKQRFLAVFDYLASEIVFYRNLHDKQ